MTVMTPEAPVEAAAPAETAEPQVSYEETRSEGGALIRVPAQPTLNRLHDRCDLNFERKWRNDVDGRANCGAEAFVFAKLEEDEESTTGLNVCAHHATSEWDKLTRTFAVIIDERKFVNEQPSVSANAA